MDARLGTTRGNPSLDSTELLQAQFRDAFASKVGPSRAEHLSSTYEFRSHVTFQLVVSEIENESLRNAARNDSATGGGAFGLSHAQALGDGKYLQNIKANDVIMNQPQADPVLQRAVSKHIIGVLNSIDGSDWIVRSVVRGAQGWTFVYNCKGSTQTWLRTQGKVARPLVGESSGKDGQDPINLGRPAFDCRGVITISFSRSNRSITVSYEHTNLHKSVAQMAELFVMQVEPVPRGPRAPYKKRKAEGEPDGQTKRKLKKKKDGEGGVAIALDDGTPNEAVNVIPNGTPKRKPRAERPSRRKPRAERPLKGTPQAGDEASPAVPGECTLGNLNLPPGEAERRTDVASKLLSDAGIEPANLSQEQFSIFANQSPDLQKESLAMLVKYGAERLRIVHPNKDVTPAPSAVATNGNPEASTKSKRPRKKKSNAGGGEGDENLVAGNETPTVKVSHPRQTRGKCEGCRARKLKCSKGRPSCEECIEVGNSCHYPEPKRKSQGPVDEEEHQSEAVEEAPEEVEEEEPDALPSPGFSQPLPPPALPTAPAAEISGSLGHDASGWSQSGGDLAYTQTMAHTLSQQATTSASGLDYSPANAQPARQTQSLLSPDDSQQSYNNVQRSTAYAQAVTQAAPQQARRSRSSGLASPFPTPTAPPAQPNLGVGRREQGRVPMPNHAPLSVQHQGTSLTGPSLTNSVSMSNYDDAYSQYTGGWKDQTSSTTQYQPSSYPNHTSTGAATASSSSYPSYDTYNTRTDAPASSYRAPVSDSLSNSYTPSTAPPNNQWLSSQNNYGYNANQAGTAVYGLPPAATRPSSSLSSYNPQSSRSGMHMPGSGGLR